MLLYVFLVTFSSILRHIMGTSMPGVLMAFLATSIAIIIFSVLGWSDLKATYKFMFLHIKFYLSISMLILIIWLGCFLNPIYFSPSIHLFTFLIIPSILGSLSIYIKRRNICNLMKCIIFFAIVIWFYYLLYTRYTPIKYLLMVVATVLTGISAFIYYMLAEKLNNQNIKPIQILATRFWGLWLCTLLIALYDNEFTKIKLFYISDSLFIGIVSLVMPTYFLHKAIGKLGASQSALLVGAAPFCCFVLEKYIFNMPSGEEYICSIIYLIMLLIFQLCHRVIRGNCV